MAELSSEQPSIHHLTSPDYGRVREEQIKSLQELVRHHVESFNFMAEEGLSYAVEDLPTYEILAPGNTKVSFFLEEAAIGYPSLPDNAYANTIKIFPSECRQKACTYKAKMSVTMGWMVNGEKAGTLTRVVGQVPIMVKSKLCRLLHMGPKELIQAHEEAEEFGGYFIVNGNERLIRMLIMTRRNYPIAINRSSWKTRGPLYTEHGIIIRSVRKDQTSANLTLHYLTDGSCMLQFSRNKELFYVPVVYILKALNPCTDIQIYNRLIEGNETDTFLKGCVASMLRSALDEGLTSQSSVLKFIGERFRYKTELPPWTSDQDVALHLIRELVLVHLTKNGDKFNMLILMTRKLYALASGHCAAESVDSPSNQEILLGGHLYLTVLKEQLDSFLQFVKSELEKQTRVNPDCFKDSKTLDSYMAKLFSSGRDIGRDMEYFLATGNLRSKSGLGLQQRSGFTVVAEKLNFYRYLSHFRAVHRGAFFSEMRTTTVRKLLPEAWGFLCPVHTPDGAPCGLLNHLAAMCKVITDLPSTAHMPRLLVSLGMTPLGSPSPPHATPLLPVLLDGRIVGEVEAARVKVLATKLRTLKALGQEKVPPTLEVGLVPALPQGQYPGLFLFTSPARMMRPVLNMATNTKELIGSFEQVYMDIAIIPEEAHQNHTTHLELNEGSMLSAIATLTPFSDFNQSPRNMYQCQMGKQTMGTPVHSFPYRSDSKMYRLQTPQAPLVRPSTYDQFGIDEYPLGTNAIVAVISYTGYDMEDAMILNKAAVERGLAHASIYKSEFVDLLETSKVSGRPDLRFGVDKLVEGKLEADGFPSIGTYLSEGDPFYSYIDEASGKASVVTYKSLESAYVDQVKIIGSECGNERLQKAFVKLRINRNPIIGDKFASRAGQKGICSQKWPVENMPFTETGMVPDIIFNPHGFPSRMTIGMMIEMMAGKSSSLHGLCHDCTPFTFSEDRPAVKHFGELLVQAGYNYYGNERLYSGVDGREFEADIFMGVVYYQRLRHMVSDKFQVRTTGPIDILTHQPVKGRKRAGGIRFGEMERDSLLAHGSSFLLQDRLLNCSDRSFSRICKECGSIVSPVLERAPPSDSTLCHAPSEWKCRLCQDKGKVDIISVPYVFRYLIAELAAMNIRVKVQVS